jgi:hypothetical protein
MICGCAAARGVSGVEKEDEEGALDRGVEVLRGV